MVNKTFADIAADEKLVDLLRGADCADLTSLVAIITDNGAGRLALSAVVREVLIQAKDAQPFLDGELRLLAREIQLFGGNSLHNVTRGGGASYKQIVSDVLKHISDEVSADDESTAQIELKVLVAVTKRLWTEADDAGRQTIAKSLGISSKLFAPDWDCLSEVVRKGGLAAVTVALLEDSMDNDWFTRIQHTISKQVVIAAKKPAGFLAAIAARALPITAVVATGGWGANKLAGEAYRITLPCVVRIASIRQKQLLRIPVFSTNPVARCSSKPPNTDASQVGAGQSWHIGTSSDRPIVSVSMLLNSNWKTNTTAVNVTRVTGLDRLAPILQAVPGLGAAMQQSGGEYLRVVVNGPLAAAADGNGLRGWVHDGRHITEQARFFEDPKLQNLVNSAAIFNIASTVVAQKHLADISKRLDAIEQGVAAIQNTLVNVRRANITGAVAYLRQVAGAVICGSQTPSIRHKLEDLEVLLISTQHHLETDLQDLGNSIQTMKNPSPLGTGDLAAALKAQQPKCLDLIQHWILCQIARMAACQLTSAFPGEEQFVRARQQAIAEGASVFFAETGVAKQVQKAFNSRMEDMSSFFESKSETYARQLSIERWKINSLQPILKNALMQVSGTDLLLNAQAQSVVTLALRIGHQGDVEAYHLREVESQVTD